MMRTRQHLRFDGTRPQSSRCVTRKQPPEVERSVFRRCFCVTVRPLLDAAGAHETTAGSPPPRVPRRSVRKPGSRQKSRRRAVADGPAPRRAFVRRRGAPLFGRLAGLPLIWGDDSASGHLGTSARHPDDTRGALSRPIADTPGPPFGLRSGTRPPHRPDGREPRPVGMNLAIPARQGRTRETRTPPVLRHRARHVRREAPESPRPDSRARGAAPGQPRPQSRQDGAAGRADPVRWLLRLG